MLVSLASEQLAAQVARHAALKDAYQTAGLGDVPELNYELASSAGGSVAAAASISLAHALVAFMRGPLRQVDLTSWTEACIKTIIAKGAGVLSFEGICAAAQHAA